MRGRQRVIVGKQQVQQQVGRKTGRQFSRRQADLLVVGQGILTDLRLAHPANAAQRADVLRASQHALGNRAVQRLLRPRPVGVPAAPALALPTLLLRRRSRALGRKRGVGRRRRGGAVTYAAWLASQASMEGSSRTLLGKSGLQLIVKIKARGRWREPVTEHELRMTPIRLVGWSIGPLWTGKWRWATYGTLRRACLRTHRQETYLRKVVDLLGKIPRGRDAVGRIKGHKVGIDFARGKGAWYDPSSNQVTLDTTESTGDAALTLVHEMSHAEYEHRKLVPEVTKVTKEEYVKKCLEDETEATVRAIEAKAQLKAAGVNVSRLTAPLERAFAKACNSAVRAAKAKDPKAPEADLKRIGREAGWKRVFEGFKKGEVTTSTTSQTYPVYYGGFWDKENKAKRKVKVR